MGYSGRRDAYPTRVFLLCGVGILPAPEFTPFSPEEFVLNEPRRREEHEGRGKKK